MEHRTVVAVLLVVALGAVTAGTPATAQSDGGGPTVSVDVDAEPLDDGDRYHTPTDPWIRVRASADDPISIVEVRVNGTTRHRFEPSTESVDRNVVLDLATGEHRVTVVARAGGVTTHEATIVKDDEAPVVTYDDPVEGTSLDSVPYPLTVENSTLTVAGTIEDASSIEYVRIDHGYEYERPASRDDDDDDGDFAYDIEDQAPFDPQEQLPVNEGESDDNDDGDDDDVEARDQYSIESPGTRFNESLTLALGTNYLRIVVEDAAGNTAADHLAVTVSDDDGPSLNVTHVEYVSPTRLRIEGWASDEVQVNDVWLQEQRNTSDEDDVDEEAVETGTDRGSDSDDAADETQNVTVRHRLVFRQSTAPDRSRRNVSFNTTVYHPPGEDAVVIGVNDTARNDRVRNYSLSTFLAPTITVDEARTGYLDGGGVAVGGRVADGQIDDVSVEAVDPSTGRIVDIRPVALGPDGTFGVRLDGAPDSTRLRIRARDVSGTEHVEETTVDAPAEDPATPSRDEDDPGTETPDDTAPDDATTDEADDRTFRIPVVGVTVPLPSLGVPSPLDASVSIPLLLVGPIDLPLAPVGLVVLGLVVVVARRR